MRIAAKKPVGVIYGCLLILQGLFYLQSLSPDLLDVAGKWEMPLAYSLLFACLAWLWFREIGRVSADGVASRKAPWLLGIAGIMQAFPIYYWWTYDHVMMYHHSVQPAMACIAAHAMFAVFTLVLLFGRKT